MDDIDKLDATLARLEAEREQRLAERIEAGELVSIPLFIVAGSESEEEAKASKLAELRAAGDLREVVFDVTMVVTGVSKYGEATGEPWKPMSPPYLPRSSSLAPEANEEEAVREVPQPVIESYVQVQSERAAMLMMPARLLRVGSP